MKCIPLEGNEIWLDGGAMFGNAPRELWRKWKAPDELNRICLATRALLIETEEGKRILLEAGVGTFFDEKLRGRYRINPEHRLLQSLAAVGLSDADIDQVILSHLHFDHVGGLLSAAAEGPLRLLFPNAQFFVGKQHWEAAHHPHIREQASFIPQLHRWLEESNRLQLIDEGQHPDLDNRFSFRFFDGHTIGLMATVIELPEGPLMFVSDMIPGVPWMHLPITMGYDRFSELLVDEKKRLLGELADRNGRVFLTHDCEEPCLKIVRDETGRLSGVATQL